MVEPKAVILVEGVSDRIAVEVVARRLGRHLVREGVAVVPMGGAHAIARQLAAYAELFSAGRVVGLCDKGAEGAFRRGLEAVGLEPAPTRAGLERLGFQVCVVDLEDELIRAVGPAQVEHLLDSQGDLAAFRTLQNEPYWRGQEMTRQLRRFFGSGATRKTRYAGILAGSLEPAAVPRPLAALLSRV